MSNLQSLEQRMDRIDYQVISDDKDKRIAILEAKLAESEKKLNQYPYKNDVIERQYEDLKYGIKFRIENNITNDWEQLYHCIDVLCEKHKARIRDIENGICSIEQLEQQLANTEAQNKRVLEKLDIIVRSNQELERKLADYEHDLDEAYKLDDIYAEKLRKRHEDYEKLKIEFAIAELEKLLEKTQTLDVLHQSGHYINQKKVNVVFKGEIDQLIKELKEKK